MSEPEGADFRVVMARWATGVSVVTSRDTTGDAGLTVNALLSVSLHPPSLLVSLARAAETTAVVERSRLFAASFLASDQRELSARFAQEVPSPQKFDGVGIHRTPEGLAVLDGGLGAVSCRVVSLTPAYDHVLVLGEVTHVERGRDGSPLLFYRSVYAEPAGEETLRLPPGRR